MGGWCHGAHVLDGVLKAVSSTLSDWSRIIVTKLKEGIVKASFRSFTSAMSLPVWGSCRGPTLRVPRVAQGSNL